MPLSRRASKKIKSLALPISYRTDEKRDRLISALNVYAADTGTGGPRRLDSRFGYSRAIAVQFGSQILSMSFFKNSAGTIKNIVKASSVIYEAKTTGAHTSLKTGLSTTSKHRGLTFDDRHIVACEADGIFQHDGTNFSVFGTAVPSNPTTAVSTGGSLAATNNYKVYLSFYSSTTGFESNPSTGAAQATTGTDKQIDLSAIPSSNTNATIDTVYIYLEDVTANGDPLFVASISLGTTTYTIDTVPTSTQTVQTKHGPPPSGGGKYITEFNRKLVLGGNPSFPNDIYFSEQDFIEGFDPTSTQLVLFISGQGAVTGIATGFFTDSNLEPYLVIFKRNATWVYSEIGGISRLVMVDDKFGCISAETIEVINGNILYMSTLGWKVIVNGKVLTKNQFPTTLGDGDIDDIFRSNIGFAFELNRSDFSNFHSIYYPDLDHYMTFITEGTSTNRTRCYVYQMQAGGFTLFDFSLGMNASMLSEDSNGNAIIMMSDANGWIYKYSTQESRYDVDVDNTSLAYQCNALLPWIQGDDFDSTYNFRELIVRALTSSNDILVSYWVNYNFQTTNAKTYSFPNPSSGFVLDVSKLDEGILGDERSIVTARNDLNIVGENLLIGFYQEVADGNMALISAQLDLSKNGNRN